MYHFCRTDKRVNIGSKKYKDRLSSENAQRCTTVGPLNHRTLVYTMISSAFYKYFQLSSIYHCTIVLPLSFGSGSDIQ